MDQLHCYAPLNKIKYRTLLLSVLQYNLMFLLKQRIVLVLDSSLRKSLIDVCVPVDLLVMPKELKHWETSFENFIHHFL